MVSLKDIAAACGVSVATVSKALNGRRDVSRETRERITRMAQELGYIPGAAGPLKTHRTCNIGVLCGGEPGSGLPEDYRAALLDSFRCGLEEEGYDLTFITRNMPRSGRMSYLAHARLRAFDGICIVSGDFRNPELAELLRSSIPIVTIDEPADNHTAIVSDNDKGMQQLVNNAYSLGHRRLACIHGQSAAVTQARLSSFLRTAEELGISVPPEYLRASLYRSTALTFERTLELLDLPEPPTCIFCPDDFAAIGCMNAVHSRGLSVPGDISVAGYGGLPLSRCLRPMITTIRQDTEKLGRTAANALVAHIEHPGTAPVRHILVPGTLQAGESVGRI